MLSFKQSLDRYLTAAPDDSFSNWCEQVDQEFSDIFWTENEDWLTQYTGQCNDLLNKLYKEGFSPAEAAKIIEQEKNEIDA